MMDVFCCTKQTLQTIPFLRRATSFHPRMAATMILPLACLLAMATVRCLLTEICQEDQARRRRWASRRCPSQDQVCSLRHAEAIPSLQPHRALLRRRRPYSLVARRPAITCRYKRTSLRAPHRSLRLSNQLKAPMVQSYLNFILSSSIQAYASS